MSTTTIIAALLMANSLAPVLPPMCPKTTETPNVDKDRRWAVRAVKSGEIKVTPLFSVASFNYGAPAEPELAFEYRRKGDTEWKRSEVPAYYAADFANWRGMFTQLAEDTEYEMRVVGEKVGGESRDEVTFRTLKSEVPVARTVVIDPKTVQLPLRISDQGTEDGWVRYTMAPGAAIVNTNREGAVVFLEKAKYVLLDGLRIVGGPVARVIDINGCNRVRVRNCEVTGWGVSHYEAFVDHKQFWYQRGKIVDGLRVPEGSVWSAAIHARNSHGTVIERCYLHDPTTTSVAWRYYHPYGAIPICLGKACSATVVRYNDLVGDDAHRWDDAIISNGNFHDFGGPGKDAEIYGNFCLHPNDDCIELDGAQNCVACWGNRFEGGLVGISLQGNMVSPSYVYDNLISGRGDYFGESGQAIKTSGFDWIATFPYSLVLRNVVWGDAGTGIGIPSRCGKSHDPKRSAVFSNEYARIDVVDNVFCGPMRIRAPEKTASVIRGNREGVAPTYDLLDPMLPKRPLGFSLDTVRIDVDGAASRVVRAIGSNGEHFTVRKNDSCDWFTVEPMEGVMRSGLEFTVRLDARKLVGAPEFRGAFLVRTDDGLSRPVTIYAKVPYTQPLRCEKPGDVALYAFPTNATLDKRGFANYRFEVPKKGRYYVMAFAQADKRPIVTMAFDEEAVGRTIMQTGPDYPVWGILSNHHSPKVANRLWGGRVCWYDLEPGTHRLRFKFNPKEARVEALVLTDNPYSFEPKMARTEK